MKIHENALLGHLGCPRLLQAAPWLPPGCPRLPQAAPGCSLAAPWLPQAAPGCSSLLRLQAAPHLTQSIPHLKLPPEALGTAPETPKDTEEGI